MNANVGDVNIPFPIMIECDCGELLMLDAKQSNLTICRCGRKYKPELRIYHWEANDLVIVPEGEKE